MNTLPSPASPPPQPPLTPPPHGSRALWVTVAAMVLLFAVMVTGGFFLLNRVVWGRQAAYKRLADSLPGELAGAKSEGLPLAASDLRHGPPVPDAENAAPLYREAHRLYLLIPEAIRKDKAPYDYLKPEKRNPASRAKAQECLRREAAVLQLGERAAALPHCDFNRPWEQGASVRFPEYATMREIARLLALRGILESEAGNPNAALRDVATGARIGVHAGSDPCAIALLVRVAIHTIMNRPFVAVLQRYGTRPDILKQAAATEAAFGGVPDTGHMIGGELVTDRAMVQGVRDSPDNSPDELKALAPPGAGVEQRRMIADAWESRFIDYWRRVHRDLARAHGDLYRERSLMEQLGSGEQSRWKDAGYELNAILMPVFARAVVREQQCESERRLRIVAESLLSHRAATGRYPDSLTEMPGIPSDPFSDAPFRYKKTPNGFLVYSVGKNQKDDGGDDRSKDADGFTNDIVLRYPS